MHDSTTNELHTDRARSALLGRGIWLEVFTIGWNVLEAVIAIGAGIVAGSVALVGFGLDSVIESISAVALHRRLTFEFRGGTKEESEASERRALWFVGVSFFLITAYVAYDAASSLLTHSEPDESYVGIVLAALSLVVMPLLAWAKRRTGKALESRALIADAAETFVCAYLSFALLLGLALNAALGWWWADPVAALLMLPLIVREGKEAIDDARGEDVHRDTTR